MKLAVLSHPTEFVHIYSKGVLKSIYQKYIGRDDEKKNIMEINKAIFEKFREGFNIDISSGGVARLKIYTKLYNSQNFSGIWRILILNSLLIKKAQT